VPLLQTGSKVATAGGGYLDMGSWIEEISVSQKRQPIETAPSTIPPAVTAGNLAALEEDFAGMLLRSQPPAARRVVGTPSPSGVALAVPAPRPALTQPDPTPAPVNLPALARRSNAGTKVGVAVALVVVMAAGAAAWLTHVMHP